jgi:biotin operon repressor
MKRIMVVNGRAMRLLQDPLNQRVLKLLVESELSVKRLSRLLGESPLKIWRRVQRLKEEGLVEETRSVHVRNLEVKLFRATSARYIPRETLEYEPKEDTLKRAYALFYEIQSKILSLLHEYEVIPSNVNPIDFCVATELYAYAKLLTDEDAQKKLKNILDLLEKCSYASVILRERSYE